MKNVILDSSVIAKWFFPDEKEGAVSLQIREDFTTNLISISVPQLIYYEVNNLLKSAVKSLRIEEKVAISAYEGFLDLDFIIYSPKKLLNLTLKTALSLDISSYDAAYLSLADYLQIPLFTADQKLLEKAGHPFIKPLGSYV